MGDSLHNLRMKFSLHKGCLGGLRGTKRARLVRPRVKENETLEMAMERRLKESQRVEARVTYVHNKDEWREQLQGAGNNLVVLEVSNPVSCMLCQQICSLSLPCPACQL